MIISLRIPPVFFQIKFILFFQEIIGDEHVDLSVAPGLTTEKTFFGPFYGSYVVFELDHADYQYSLVCGPDKSYLWILARKPKMEKEVQDTLVAKAAALGFDTSALIYVDHR